jgi:hypothetical protein
MLSTIGVTSPRTFFNLLNFSHLHGVTPFLQLRVSEEHPCRSVLFRKAYNQTGLGLAFDTTLSCCGALVVGARWLLVEPG